MEEKLFVDQRIAPTERALRAGLGPAYRYFYRITKAAGAYSQDWTFTKSGGWMLKVWRAKKALFYAIPLKRELKISMAIRENEMAAFLRDDDLKMIRDKFIDARKFSEGFALQFKLASARDQQEFDLFLHKMMDIRNDPNRPRKRQGPGPDECRPGTVPTRPARTRGRNRPPR